MLDILCATRLSNFYPTNLAGDLNYKHVFSSRVENSVDPDQLASKKPADQDPHVFKMEFIQVEHGQG